MSSLFPDSLDDVPTNFRPKYLPRGSYEIAEVLSCEDDAYDGGIAVNAMDGGNMSDGDSDGDGCEPAIIAQDLETPVNSQSIAYLEPHTEYEFRGLLGSVFFTTGAGPDDSFPTTPVIAGAYRTSFWWPFPTSQTTTLSIELEEPSDEQIWWDIQLSDTDTFDDFERVSSQSLELVSGTCQPSVGANLKTPSFVRVRSVNVGGNASDFSEPVWIGPGCGCSTSSSNGDGLLWLGVFALGFVYLRRRT
jgi:MYXO-CTERM domain-containing protein